MLEFGFGSFDEALLFAHGFDRGQIVRLDLIRGDEDVMKLLAIDGLQVAAGDLDAAALANIFR